MVDENPEFSNLSDYPIKPLIEKRFGRLFQKINQLFKKREPEQDIKLSGRITELQTSAEKILIELLNIKDCLEKDTDPKLFSMVNVILEPMIKEISHIQKVMEEQQSVAHQVKAFRRYAEWIDKAKLWVDIGGRRNEKGLIHNAVISHIIQEFQACIDRDIQIIQDYLNHALASCELNEDLRPSIKENLEPELDSHLFILQQLKRAPEDLSLDSLSSWRSDSDRVRENYFSDALHLIDTFISPFTPRKAEEKMGDHIVKIIVEINLLEEKIDNLVSDILGIDANDNKSKKICLSTLNRLEEEAHRLNGDLNLPHEHSDRMLHAIETLTDLREQLSA